MILILFFGLLGFMGSLPCLAKFGAGLGGVFVCVGIDEAWVRWIWSR
jgi:hypothetical protein